LLENLKRVVLAAHRFQGQRQLHQPALVQTLGMILQSLDSLLKLAHLDRHSCTGARPEGRCIARKSLNHDLHTRIRHERWLYDRNVISTNHARPPSGKSPNGGLGWDELIFVSRRGTKLECRSVANRLRPSRPQVLDKLAVIRHILQLRLPELKPR